MGRWTMITADHISFNDDETAWWVRDDALPDSPSGWPITALDRPCDRCDGHGRIVHSSGVAPFCPDCSGTGRHTFTVELVRAYDEPGTENKSGERYTLRVSVVPGMVLPIVEKWEHRPNVGSFITRFDGATRLWTDADLYEHVALPPDAKPGQWAVKLAVQP